MSQQEQQSVSHDIFADPQIANAKVDDPLFRFLFENWRLLASVAATVLIGYFAYGSYTKARNANLARSSELYSSMRETFTALEGVQNKIESQKGEVSAEDPLLQEKKELEEKVGHQLSALAETKAPYGELAALYANIVSSRYGLSTKVDADLSSDAWKKVSASDSNERFLKEMEGFLAGKLLLEREETRSKGWSELKELAQKGTYWRALAALTLARMTVAAADKADVLALLEAVEKEQPEQSDLIRGELDRLGQSAKEISQE